MSISELTANYSIPAPARMSEDRLERIAEGFFNRLDKRFMSSAMTQAEYDEICKAFAAWEAACR